MLAEAVRIRLMSDVPLGAMLSGGLDSSLVVALMAEASTQPVQTFAIGFREDGDQNELRHAERVARLFGCDHHEIELSFEDDVEDLEDVIWHLDEPVAELSAVGFHALSRLAASKVTVALSGQGADELFGGYRKHLAARMIDLSHLPAGARRPLAAAPARGDLRRLLQASAARTPTDRLLAMSSAVDGAALNRLRGPRLRALDGLAARRAVDRIAEHLPPRASALGSTLYLDGQLALVDNMLHYFDRMSMAVSLRGPRPVSRPCPRRVGRAAARQREGRAPRAEACPQATRAPQAPRRHRRPPEGGVLQAVGRGVARKAPRRASRRQGRGERSPDRPARP